MRHITKCDDATLLPFAISRIAALKATGLAFISQKYVIDGAEVSVEIAGDQEFISISGECPATPGYLLTQRRVISGELAGLPVYSDAFFACFPEEIIGLSKPVDPLTGVVSDLPDGHPGRKYRIPDTTIGKVGTEQRWPSLYSGRMRYYAQLAQLTKTGNIFGFRWGCTHGVRRYPAGNGHKEADWLIEISDRVYAAKVTRGPCVMQSLAAVSKKYKNPSTGLVDLKWAYGEPNQVDVRILLEGSLTASADGAPLNEVRGWAFNYVGDQAQCVLFDSITNAYNVTRIKMVITGEFEPESARVDVLESKEYINNIRMLVWYPSDEPYQYKQLEVMAEGLDPSVDLGCTNVPIDVYFSPDGGEMVTYVSQQSGEVVDVDTNISQSCEDTWASGGFPCSPNSLQGWNEIESVRNFNADDTFVTPAGSYTRRNRSSEVTRRDVTCTPIDSWAVSELVGTGIRQFESWGWVFRSTAETVSVSDGRAAVVLGYFDRESMILVSRQTSEETTTTTRKTYWALLQSGSRLLSQEEIQEFPTVPVLSPCDYPPRPTCFTPIPGRLSTIGDYHLGTDPPDTVTTVAGSTDEMRTSISVGATTRSGDVIEAEKSVVDLFLEFRNVDIDVSPYEPVNLFGYASAACTIDLKRKAKDENFVLGTLAYQIRTSDVPVYEGPIQDDGGGSYRGFAGVV